MSPVDPRGVVYGSPVSRGDEPQESMIMLDQGGVVVTGLGCESIETRMAEKALCMEGRAYKRGGLEKPRWRRGSEADEEEIFPSPLLP